MSRPDFTPYRRSTVGFDHLFDLLENKVRQNTGDNYPPFNIERRGDDEYRITLAVAGFRPDDIDITAICIVREVPEAMKPKKIAVNGQTTLKAVPSRGDNEADAA